MQILKTHLPRLEKAIEYCDAALEELIKKIDTIEESVEIKENFKHLIRTKTYFAGGVFRCMFNNTKVKDIDVFFVDEESALEFTSYVMLNSSIGDLFGKTEFYTFNYDKLSFITHNTGDPLEVIKDFDTTLNMSYYKSFTKEFSFFTDTFRKKGEINFRGESFKIAPLNVMTRIFKFLKEGFSISDRDLMLCLHSNVMYKRNKSEVINDFTNFDSAEIPRTPSNNLPLLVLNHNDFYTDKDLIKTKYGSDQIVKKKSFPDRDERLLYDILERDFRTTPTFNPTLEWILPNENTE